MIPKGNMMVSMLKKVEGGFNVFQFKCSDKEVKENLELEAELKTFFEGGVTNMVKDGVSTPIESISNKILQVKI